MPVHRLHQGQALFGSPVESVLPAGPALNLRRKEERHDHSDRDRASEFPEVNGGLGPGVPNRLVASPAGREARTMSVIKGRLMTRDPHIVGLADESWERVRWKPRLVSGPRAAGAKIK